MGQKRFVANAEKTVDAGTYFVSCGVNVDFNQIYSFDTSKRYPATRKAAN
jgi:hypothetical protein